MKYLIIGILAVSLAGCASSGPFGAPKSPVVRGALTGGALGCVVGAIAGSVGGNAGVGCGVGAGAGAIIGGGASALGR